MDYKDCREWIMRRFIKWVHDTNKTIPVIINISFENILCIFGYYVAWF